MKNLRINIPTVIVAVVLSILIGSSALYAVTYPSAKGFMESPATGDIPVQNASGFFTGTDPSTLASGTTLDDAYDNGDTIDYSSGNGPVVMNFPAAGTTDPIAEAILGGNYQIRNQWIQANDAELLDVSALYLTTSADVTPQDYHMMGITSTDSGSNNYTRWLVTSLGFFQGIGFSVNNYPTNANQIHVIDQTIVNFNVQQDDIDFLVKTTGSATAFVIDAGDDTAKFAIPVTVTDSITVVSTTVNTGGGLQRIFSEATSGALSGASGTIQVNVPTGAKIIGVQLRVDTLITSGDGADTWTANLTTAGPVTVQEIGSGLLFDKNTKPEAMFDPIAASPVAQSEIDITLLPTPAGTFSGGVVRALVYYWDFIVMDNNP